jgi:hypothetical protein
VGEFEEKVMRKTLVAALALATAACGGGGRNQATNAANDAAPGGNQVAALSEGQRNAVFIRAIRDAGLDCQHVERSVPGGTSQGISVWRATCQGGGEFTIEVGADGNAQVMVEAGAGRGNQAATNAAADGGRPD